MAGSEDEGARRRRGDAQDSNEPLELARKPLPKSIQQNLDSEEKLWEVMYEGK